jgi:hypothetical protein
MTEKQGELKETTLTESDLKRLRENAAAALIAWEEFEKELELRRKNALASAGEWE